MPAVERVADVAQLGLASGHGRSVAAGIDDRARRAHRRRSARPRPTRRRAGRGSRGRRRRGSRALRGRARGTSSPLRPRRGRSPRRRAGSGRGGESSPRRALRERLATSQLCRDSHGPRNVGASGSTPRAARPHARPRHGRGGYGKACSTGAISAAGARPVRRIDDVADREGVTDDEDASPPAARARAAARARSAPPPARGSRRRPGAGRSGG